MIIFNTSEEEENGREGVKEKGGKGEDERDGRNVRIRTTTDSFLSFFSFLLFFYFFFFPINSNVIIYMIGL